MLILLFDLGLLIVTKTKNATVFPMIPIRLVSLESK